MPTTKKKEPTLLELLTERREAASGQFETRVNAFEAEHLAFEARSATDDDAPTEEERAAFDADLAAFKAETDQIRAEIADFDKRIEDQNEILCRRAEAAAAHAEVVDAGDVVEPLTYRRDNGRGMDGISYYRDLACAMLPDVTFGTTNRQQSQGRLDRHAAEMDVEIPKRVAAAEKRALEKVNAAERAREGRGLLEDPFHRGATYNPVEQRVEPNRTDGYGGYFIPPLWLPEEYIPGLRAHSVAAGLCRQLDLPSGTDSINIPKLNTLTSVGYQTADNAGVVSQDWTDTFVQANVKTAAGESDVALQLLEQSPNGITDEVITTDLMAAYNQFVDLQVITGDGLNTGQLAGGHILGIYPSSNWTNTNGVTWTSSSPQGYSFQQALGAMASQIAKTRFDASNFKVVMHGRRWFWYTTSLDGNDRPLGESMNGGPFNVASLIEGGLQAEGLVGTLPSVANAPVYIDDNIPTTDNAGTPLTGTDDVAIAALWDDLWLFKGDLRTNVFREVLSGSLGVRFQVYNYFAFLVRYGQSLAVATGTGFSAPQGSIDNSIKF